MISKFEQFYADEYKLEQVQNNIANFALQLEKNPLLDGRLIQGEVFAIGNNTVVHKLQREPIGYIITNTNAAITPYTVSKDSTTIVINSGAVATVDIWVF